MKRTTTAARRGGRAAAAAEDAKQEEEVEQMLQAAQDELLLKLSVDSHMSRGVSPDYLHPDLHRRFHALKSKPSRTLVAPTNPTTSNSPNQSSPSISTLPKSAPPREDAAFVDEDHLFARFAALKASSPGISIAASAPVGTGGLVNQADDDHGEEDDEVEKIIRWAKDAARLDPSPPADDDEGGDLDETDEDDVEHKVSVPNY